MRRLGLELLPKFREVEAGAAEECAELFAVAWSVPDAPAGQDGRFVLVIAITGSDEVDAAERAVWLGDEIGALDPDGRWLIAMGLAE